MYKLRVYERYLLDYSLTCAGTRYLFNNNSRILFQIINVAKNVSTYLIRVFEFCIYCVLST